MNTTHAAVPPLTPVTLRCPKCAADMVTYERSGIVLDQCRECRGIFLDRGELERLVDAESGGTGWAGPQMQAPAPIPLPDAVQGSGSRLEPELVLRRTASQRKSPIRGSGHREEGLTRVTDSVHSLGETLA